MFNYRSDRAREILTALLDPRFDGFNRNRVVAFGTAVGMVEYSAALNPFLKTRCSHPRSSRWVSARRCRARA